MDTVGPRSYHFLRNAVVEKPRCEFGAYFLEGDPYVVACWMFLPEDNCSAN